MLLFLLACTKTDLPDDSASDSAGPEHCVQADAEGRYALLEKGFIDGVPYIAGGTLSLQADGFTLEAGQSLDGVVGTVGVTSGSWTLEPHSCRGTLVDGAGEDFLDFTLVHANAELRTIRRASGTVITGRGRAAAEGCTDENIQGSYGYGINAIVYLDIEGWPVGPSHFAGSGVVEIGPAGALTLADRASIAGFIFDRSYDGELVLSSDCTAAGQVILPDTAPTSTNPVDVSIVFADERREASVIQTNGGTFIGGTAWRRDPGLSCAPRDYVGRFGFVQEGHDGELPYVAGGLLAIGDAGAVTLSGTQSTDGELSSVSPNAGTLSFDEDCRGTIVDGSGDAWLSISPITQDHFRFLRTDAAGKVITGYALRMAQGCTAENVAGSYGYAINAMVYLDLPGFPEGASPFAGAGAVRVASDGSLVLADSASIGGLILNRHYDGTMDLADDCTASAVIQLPEGAPTSTNPVNVDIYWVDEGRQALLIQKDEGTFIAGAAVRRSVME